MRIAARWIGWYSLIAVVATFVVMVLATRPALWLEPPQRLSKSDSQLVDLIRAINEAPPGSMRVCKAYR